MKQSSTYVAVLMWLFARHHTSGIVTWLTMTGYFERTLCAAWCGLPRSNQWDLRSISSAPRTAMRVMRAAMMTTVSVWLRSEMCLMIGAGDHSSAKVLYRRYLPYFVWNLRVGLERQCAGTKKRHASCGDRERSPVTTTRSSRLRAFENVLDSDESCWGVSWEAGYEPWTGPNGALSGLQPPQH